MDAVHDPRLGILAWASGILGILSPSALLFAAGCGSEDHASPFLLASSVASLAMGTYYHPRGMERHQGVLHVDDPHALRLLRRVPSGRPRCSWLG